MANKTGKVVVDVELRTQVDSMKNGIKEIENSFKNVNFTPVKKTEIDSMLQKVKDEIKQIEDLTANGLIDEKGVTKLEKSMNEVDSALQKVGKEFKTIENTSADGLKKLLPQDVINRFKELTKQTQSYNKVYKEFISKDSRYATANSSINEKTEAIKGYEKAIKDAIKVKNELDTNGELLNKMPIGYSKSSNKEVQHLDEAIKKLKELKQEREKYENDYKGKDYNRTRADKKDSSGNYTFKSAATIDKEIAGAQADYDKFRATLSEKLEVNIATKTTELQQAKNELDNLKNQIDTFDAENATRAFNSIKAEVQKIQGLNIDWTKINNIEDLKNIMNNLTQDEIQKLRAGVQQGAESFNKVGENANKARSSIKGMGTNVKEVNNSLNEMQQISSRLTYFFSLVNVFQLFKRQVREAVQEVKELDAAMTETAVVTDFSVGDMWSKLPEYTEIANKYGAAIKDAYDVMTIFYQQGLDTNEAFALGQETMQMARIASLDYADAADKMTNALRGFNMELNKTSAQRVNDVYSELAAISASDTNELATAMTKVASLANSANMEFENTAAFLAQMIETTRESAETAGTALKTVVARFAEVKKLYSKGQLTGTDEEGEQIDVNKVSTALRAAGIDLNQFMVGAKGLDDILTELAGKWDTLDLTTQRYIATMAAGSRQQSRFLALMSDNERLTELVTAAYDSNGASARQFAKTEESLESKTNRLRNSYHEFLLGLANSDAIKKAVDFATRILDFLNNITSSTDKLSSSLKKLGVSIGLISIGKMLTSGFSKGINQALLAAGAGGENIGQVFAKGFGSGFNNSAKGFGRIFTNVFRGFGKSGGLLGIKGFVDAKYGQLFTNYEGKAEEVAEKTAIAAKTMKESLLGLGGAIAGLALNKLGDYLLTLDERFNGTAMAIKGLGTAVTAAGVAFFAFTKIMQAFGLSFAANPVLAPILAIVAGIGALIASIVVIKKQIETNKSRGLKQAKSDLEAATKAATQAQEKITDLKDSWEALNESKDNLDNLIKGTTAWKEALHEANLQVLELIEKYPELKFDKNSDGLFVIDEESYKNVLDDAEKMAQLATAQKAIDNSRVEYEDYNLNRTKEQEEERKALLEQKGLSKELQILNQKHIEEGKLAEERYASGLENAIRLTYEPELEISDAIVQQQVKELQQTIENAGKGIKITSEDKKNYAKYMGYDYNAGTGKFTDDNDTEIKIADIDIKRWVAQSKFLEDASEKAKNAQKALDEIGQAFDTNLSKILSGDKKLKKTDLDKYFDGTINKGDLKKKLANLKPEDFSVIASLLGEPDSAVTSQNIDEWLDKFYSLIQARAAAIQKSKALDVEGLMTSFAGTGLFNSLEEVEELIKQIGEENQELLLGMIENANVALGDKGAEVFVKSLKENAEDINEIIKEFSNINLVNPIQAYQQLQLASKNTNEGIATTAKKLLELENFKPNNLVKALGESDDWEDLNKELDKFIKKNKQITTENIDDLADSFETLNDLLESGAISSAQLASVLNTIKLEDLGFNSFTEDVAEAITATETLSATLSTVHSDIEQFDEGYDSFEGQDWLQDAYEAMYEMASEGEYFNNQMERYQSEIFTNYDRWDKEKTQKNLRNIQSDLEDGGFGFWERAVNNEEFAKKYGASINAATNTVNIDKDIESFAKLVEDLSDATGYTEKTIRKFLASSQAMDGDLGKRIEESNLAAGAEAFVKSTQRYGKAIVVNNDKLKLMADYYGTTTDKMFEAIQQYAQANGLEAGNLDDYDIYDEITGEQIENTKEVVDSLKKMSAALDKSEIELEKYDKAINQNGDKIAEEAPIPDDFERAMYFKYTTGENGNISVDLEATRKSLEEAGFKNVDAIIEEYSKDTKIPITLVSKELQIDENGQVEKVTRIFTTGAETGIKEGSVAGLIEAADNSTMIAKYKTIGGYIADGFKDAINAYLRSMGYNVPTTNNTIETVGDSPLVTEKGARQVKYGNQLPGQVISPKTLFPDTSKTISGKNKDDVTITSTQAIFSTNKKNSASQNHDAYIGNYYKGAFLSEESLKTTRKRINNKELIKDTGVNSTLYLNGETYSVYGGAGSSTKYAVNDSDKNRIFVLGTQQDTKREAIGFSMPQAIEENTNAVKENTKEGQKNTDQKQQEQSPSSKTTELAWVNDTDKWVLADKLLQGTNYILNNEGRIFKEDKQQEKIENILNKVVSGEIKYGETGWEGKNLTNEVLEVLDELNIEDSIDGLSDAAEKEEKAAEKIENAADKIEDTGNNNNNNKVVGTGTVSSSGYISPLNGSYGISGDFNSWYTDDAGNSYQHKGIDYKTPVGTEVFAIGDATVKEKSYNFGTYEKNYNKDSVKGRGNYIVLELNDGSGRTAIYQHLSAEQVAGIEVGSQVSQGALIGYSGNSGNSKGAHLHFGMNDANGNKIDPSLYLSGNKGQKDYTVNYGNKSTYKWNEQIDETQKAKVKTLQDDLERAKKDATRAEKNSPAYREAMDKEKELMGEINTALGDQLSSIEQQIWNYENKDGNQLLGTGNGKYRDYGWYDYTTGQVVTDNEAIGKLKGKDWDDVNAYIEKLNGYADSANSVRNDITSNNDDLLGLQQQETQDRIDQIQQIGSFINSAISAAGQVAQAAVSAVEAVAQAAVDGLNSFLQSRLIKIDDETDINSLIDAIDLKNKKSQWEYEKLLKRDFNQPYESDNAQKYIYDNINDQVGQQLTKLQTQRQLIDNSKETIALYSGLLANSLPERLSKDFQSAAERLKNLNLDINFGIGDGKFEWSLPDWVPSIGPFKTDSTEATVDSTKVQNINSGITNLNRKLNEIKGATVEDLEAVASFFKDVMPKYNEETQSVNTSEIIKYIREEMDLIITKDDTVIGQIVQAYLDYYQGIENILQEESSNIREAESQILEIYDELNSLLETGKEDFLTLEEDLYNAIVSEKQAMIDELSSLNENITEADNKLIDTLRENLEKIRQQRDNEDKERDLQDKEARLAYLKQNTSGANKQEILQLEKELKDEQQDYTDTLIDQKIDELEKQNELAAEQRQIQIDLLQGELENTEEIHERIEGLMDRLDDIDSTSKDIDPAVIKEVFDILKQTEEYQNASEEKRKELEEEWTQRIRNSSNYQFYTYGEGKETYANVEIAASLIDKDTGLPEGYLETKNAADSNGTEVGWDIYTSVQSVDAKIGTLSDKAQDAWKNITQVIEDNIITTEDFSKIMQEGFAATTAVRTASGTEYVITKAIEVIASEGPGVLSEFTSACTDAASAVAALGFKIGGDLGLGIGVSAEGGLNGGIASYVASAASHALAGGANAAAMMLDLVAQTAPGAADLGVVIADIVDNVFNEFKGTNYKGLLEEETAKSEAEIINFLEDEAYKDLVASENGKYTVNQLELENRKKAILEQSYNSIDYDVAGGVYTPEEAEEKKNQIKKFYDSYFETLEGNISSLLNLYNRYQDENDTGITRLDYETATMFLNRIYGGTKVFDDYSNNPDQSFNKASEAQRKSILDAVLNNKDLTKEQKERFEQWMDENQSLSYLELQEALKELVGPEYETNSILTDIYNAIKTDVDENGNLIWHNIELNKVFPWLFNGLGGDVKVDDIVPDKEKENEELINKILNENYSKLQQLADKYKVDQTGLDQYSSDEGWLKAFDTWAESLRTFKEKLDAVNLALEANKMNLDNVNATIVNDLNWWQKALYNIKNFFEIEIPNFFKGIFDKKDNKGFDWETSWINPKNWFNGHANGGAISSNETALVGEEGPELVQHRNGGASLVGTNGPQMANLKKGDIVYTNEQTKKMFRSGMLNLDRFANGTGANLNLLPAFASPSLSGVTTSENNRENVLNFNLNLENITVDSSDRINEMADVIWDKFSTRINNAVWPFNKI